MRTRRDDKPLPGTETWVVAGTHYDDTQVVGTCSAPVFAKCRARLAREAGIDIRAMRSLAKQLDRASKEESPLLEFLMAAFLGLELSGCKVAARAIDRLVAKWPLHDPMRNDVLQITEALAQVSDMDFVIFDDVPEQSDSGELVEREVS